jgi:hypothetical protein
MRTCDALYRELTRLTMGNRYGRWRILRTAASYYKRTLRKQCVSSDTSSQDLASRCRLNWP